MGEQLEAYTTPPVLDSETRFWLYEPDYSCDAIISVTPHGEPRSWRSPGDTLHVDEHSRLDGQPSGNIPWAGGGAPAFVELESLETEDMPIGVLTLRAYVLITGAAVGGRKWEAASGYAALPVLVHLGADDHEGEPTGLSVVTGPQHGGWVPLILHDLSAIQMWVGADGEGLAELLADISQSAAE